ncbi:glycosyltransferase family 2 protein [Falsirhodobacter deserti]|uniref:glycosyltransferase family 2 protein n=1 Tax=Falsirhodobacter deserti TaxID=1365611 RepID=UPI0013E3D5B0|nr:glycosyltransferase [Falsirhodobacter deserti]
MIRRLKTAMLRTRRFAGRVERMEGRRIHGWVFDRKQPDAAVPLVLEMDGREIGRGLADLPRPDVQQAGLGPERCGFQFDLPAGLPDGRAHRLIVRLPTGATLRGATLSIQPATTATHGTAARFSDTGLKGAVERIGPNDVSGWILDPSNADRAVDLCLKVDGSVLLTATAQLERRDVLASGHARLASGFRFDLPDLLFDGHPHHVQIIENSSGAVLPGGETQFTGTSEGVAFFRSEAVAIAGWLRPAEAVSVQFNDEPPVIAGVTAPVAGLGTDRGGFEVPVPGHLLDGNWHKALVRHPATGRLLDGGAITFRMKASGRPALRGARLIGGRFEASVTDQAGQPLHLRVGIQIDGRQLPAVVSNASRATPISGERRAQNLLTFAVPPSARELALWNDEADGQLLGRWVVNDNRLWPAEQQAEIAAEISERTLRDPAVIQGAQDAFARFIEGDAPGFDPLWYGLTYHRRTDMDQAEALASYAAGAKAGQSPSPFFDEGAARRLYPAVEQAVDAGKLPCAFALYLHLGRGLSLNPLGNTNLRPLLDRVAPASPDPVAALRDLGDVTHATAHFAEAPPLVAGLLPPASAQREASECVFTAWMNRLSITASQREALHRDEEAARLKIEKSRLETRPLVSIIMPTFNRAHTIGDAIQSVLDQTYDHFELLICDDASEDKTADVIKQFDDSRVRYMQFAKSNGAGTRNKGLRFARGEVIAYLDSDNLWNPHFLDVMLRALLAQPGNSIAYCGYLDTETFGAKVTLQALSHPPFNPIALSARNFMDLNTIVHRRHVYDWLGGFDPDLPRLQDWDLMLRYSSVFRPVFVDHTLVYYRRNVAWGQVTHVFLNSGAQNNVNRKTQERLEHSHVRLSMDWPERRKVQVLAAPDGGASLLARSLNGLAGAFADIDLHVLEDTPEAMARLGFDAALENTMHPVICIGYSVPAVDALAKALPAADIFILDMGDAGLVLRDVRQSAHAWHLGALPLAEETAVKMGSPTITIFPAAEDRYKPARLAAAAREHDLDIIVPPEGMAGGDWLILHGSGLTERLSFDQGLAACLSRTRVLSCIPEMERLTPAEFSLAMHLQARGAAMALTPSPLADQWIGTRCAYALPVTNPDWIAEKLGKLMLSPDHERLAKAATTAWRIAYHPELTQERLAVALHAILHGTNMPELSHV